VVTKDFPLVHYYDQDFVDIYERSWVWLNDFLKKGNDENGFGSFYFKYTNGKTIDLYETFMASFFLVYNSRNFPVANILDVFYGKQEEDGAIRQEYSEETGEPVFSSDNPKGLCPPLFAWVEYNLYHKVGAKKRIKEVMPNLEMYYEWIEREFKDEASGFYKVPLSATMMKDAPRGDAVYYVDFNSQMAVNSLYMAALGDVLNDKELSFKYKKKYFSLKTRISSKMWDRDDNFYYDLNEKMEPVKVKTIAAYWPLLAEIPNEERAEAIILHLRDPELFGGPNPFPSVAINEPSFKEEGDGYNGSVYPPLTFMVIKALEKYGKYEMAREMSIKHLYSVLDTFHPVNGKKGTLWEAYSPMADEPAKIRGSVENNRKLYLGCTGLSTIALMIENVIGLYISLPRKTVDWIVPILEVMGIEDLNLKRNKITILSNKSGRGWEIRLESEKLYYFTIDILGEKKKTLPIPSGKCSMLIDKL
jgi:neutral trehalase